MYDRKVNLDLVQPAGVYRSMNGHDIVPPLLQSLATALPPMRGPVVHDPENPGRRTIGFLAHDLIDQSLKRIDPGALFTAPKDLGSADIPSRQVSKGACPLIFVLHLHRSARSRSHTGMQAPPRLDAGLFVCRQHAISFLQPLSFPEAFIQIQDGSCFFGKASISGKDPAAMVPGSDRIFRQPVPKGGFPHRGYQPAPDGLLPKISQAEP